MMHHRSSWYIITVSIAIMIFHDFWVYIMILHDLSWNAIKTKKCLNNHQDFSWCIMICNDMKITIHRGRSLCVTYHCFVDPVPGWLLSWSLFVSHLHLLLLLLRAPYYKPSSWHVSSTGKKTCCLFAYAGSPINSRGKREGVEIVSRHGRLMANGDYPFYPLILNWD